MEEAEAFPGEVGNREWDRRFALFMWGVLVVCLKILNQTG